MFYKYTSLSFLSTLYGNDNERKGREIPQIFLQIAAYKTKRISQGRVQSPCRCARGKKELNSIFFFFFCGTVPPRFLLCKDKCFMIIKTRNKEKNIWICNRVVHIYIVLNPWKVSPSSPISICKFIDTVSVSKAHRYKLFSVVKILYFLSQPKFIELTFRKVASLSLAKRLIYRKDYNASNSHCFD